MPYEGDDRHGARRDLRLRTLWHRCWGAVAVLLGVALIFFAGVGLARVPDDMAEERAYRATRPCGAAVTGDCLRPVQATVRGTEIREQARNQRYDLRLTGPSPVPREVAMGGTEPLLGHLRAGDVVTVTMWRDYATAVSKDGVTQYSDDNPEGLSLWSTAIALALLAIGLFAAYAGGHAVAHAPLHATTGLPARLRKRGVQTIGAVFCAVPAGMSGTWTGPVGVIVLWPALVAVLLAATRRLDAPKWGRGRHARAVTHPE
ncbi:hypothetical protein ACF09J_21585 [Streptomyces sp. NPDC014889]|uniref:hypothetical protein n=1 Tax=Streptomyces sp. NPDC014889 TaxID=3364928 RepID=UPI0037027B44